jgi:hypothetical protein
LRAPGFALVLTATALAGAGCSGDNSAEATTTTVAAADSVTAPETITVLGSRQNTGPFERSLSLELVDSLQPIPFFVCAAWGEDAAPGGCTAAPGARLPAGSTLRLEQKPPGPALRNPDSPGWGTVGTSEGPALSIPLSNGVTGDRVGTVTFRVTLRGRSGRILATSNSFTLTWRD